MRFQNMRILRLKIENFRGIKCADIKFSKSRLVCFIGSGDSTKSTLLEAIHWNLWTSWNVGATDNDFYNEDLSQSIIITGFYAELPDKLIAEDKCGLFLRNADISLDDTTNDEPTDSISVSIAIRLTIDETLKPYWELVTNRGVKDISEHDRALLSIGLVGSNCAHDLVWGRYSVLQKYADSREILKNTYTAAMREVAQKANLSQLDSVSGVVNDLGKQYGVGFHADVTNKILMQNGSFSTVVGLFDGEVPLKQRGLGSQRLLSMALNIKATREASILLIDEVENGLEPYRICNLINEFRSSHKSSGQIIMTTHSPVVVAECKLDELMVIQSNEGTTTSVSLKAPNKQTDINLQAEIRRNPSAFLCKKIIVCEGKTEYGFIRAFDNYLERAQHFRIACQGTGTAIGQGHTLFQSAYALKNCGYKVCILMDSDVDAEKSSKDEARKVGIKIFDWDDGNSIEEQIFQDVNNDIASTLVNIAVQDKGLDSITSKLDAKEIPYDKKQNAIDKTKIYFTNLTQDKRKLIGLVAKEHNKGNKTGGEWFKRIDQGEEIGNVIFGNWEQIDQHSKLYTTLNDLFNWVKIDE